MVQEGEKLVYRKVGKTNLFTVESSVTWSKFCLGFLLPPAPPSQLQHFSFSSWTLSFSSVRKWNMAVIGECCKCQEVVSKSLLFAKEFLKECSHFLRNVHVEKAGEKVKTPVSWWIWLKGMACPAFSAFCDTLDCVASCESRLTVLWESSMLPAECLGIPIAAWEFGSYSQNQYCFHLYCCLVVTEDITNF